MKILIDGFIVGATMLVPGVSGGTMAIILGIYNDLIYCLQELNKENIFYLLKFALGAIGGIFIFSRPILTLYEKYYLDVIYFFVGTILASSYLLFNELKIKYIKLEYLLYIIGGILFVLLFNKLPQLSLDANVFVLFMCGIVLSIALILPGISVSYVLLLLGLYDQVISALSIFNLMILIPLIIGLIIGIIIVSRLINFLINQYKIQSYMMILGFVFASIFMIIPSLPKISSLILMIIGFITLVILNKIIL